MLAAVREIEDEGCLRVGSRRSRNTSRRARRRQAAVRGDGKSRADRGAVGEPRRYAVTLDSPVLHQGAPPVDGRMRHDGCFERRVQVAVGNVQAKEILADLCSAKGHDRASDEPRRCVDDPHCLQRSGFGRKGAKHADLVEQAQGRAHQRRRAPIVGACGRTCKRDRHIEAGETEGCDQTGRSGSRNDDRR